MITWQDQMEEIFMVALLAFALGLPIAIGVCPLGHVHFKVVLSM